MRHKRWHDTTIEQGANWIHGTGNNPIYELAQKYGLVGSFEERHPVIRSETGSDTTPKARSDEFRAAVLAVEELVRKRRAEKAGDISNRDALTAVGWRPANPEQSVVEYLEYDFETAVPPEHVSARVLLNTDGAIQSVTGQQFFVTDPRGYAYIVERLAGEFLVQNDPRLKLNRRVRTIRWSDSSVKVNTDGGETFIADYALITFSVGVLKSENNIKFLPELPAWKRAAISKLDVVFYTKIFLKFDKQFWDDNEFILYASKRRGFYPVWQSLSAGSRLPRDTNILLVTATGDEAQRIQHQSVAQTQSEIMEILRRVYGADVPDPVDIYYPRWCTDPFFMGSWTNMHVGTTGEDLNQLSAPTGRLFFGGEATSELYNGFVHGGYLSGIARAEDIVKCIHEHYCPLG